MANTLRFKRGLASGLPTGLAGEPLFTTDTFDLYIGNGSGNTRFQKYIASGATTQILRGDGSLYTFPLAISSPSTGQVLKYNGTSWVNDSDSGITGSGSAGQVAYFTGATTQAGSNNLFWDNTNGRLGIGITTPLQTLHINGTARIGNTLATNGATTIEQVYVGDQVLGVISARQGSGALLLGYGAKAKNGADGYISTFDNFSARRALLDINQGYFDFVNTASVNTARGSDLTPTVLMRLNTTGNLLINTTTDSGQRLQVIGTGYFSDSVGIGSTSLTAISLLVSKNISGSALGYGIHQNGQIQSGVNFGLGIANTPSIAASLTISSYRSFYTANPSIGSGSTVAELVGYYVESNFVGGTATYGFQSAIPSGTGRWNIYMSGTAPNYLNGSLLIGSTTDSGEKLQVTGTMKVTGASTFGSSIISSGLISAATEFRLNNHSFARIAILNTSGGIAGGYNLTLSSNVAQHDSTGNIAGYYHHNNGYIAFYTNTSQAAGTVATERMRLDASGNLGLGVTPSAWSVLRGLQVGLTASVSGYAASTEGAFFSSNSFYNGGAFVYQVNGNATSYVQISGQHRWNTAASGTAGNAITFTQAMTLDASGNLAIGTTTTTNRLEVWGTGNTAARIVGQSAGNATLILSSGGVTAYSIKSGNGDSSLRIDQDGSERIMLASGGNLLIGSTTNSGEKLQVTGTAKITGATTLARFTATTSSINLDYNSGILYHFGGTVNYYQYGTGANYRIANRTATGSLIFATNDVDRISISSDGNLAVDTNTLFVDATNNRVGVGTASPTYTLHTVVPSATSADIFIAGMTGVSNGFTVQRVSSNFVYTFLDGNVGIGVTPTYKLHVQGNGYFNDNVRFPNLKGVVFVQSGGSLLGSISMDSSNQVTIDNNGFFGLSVGSNYNLLGGNTGIGTSSFGTSATRTFAILNGTAPSSSPVDSFQLYSNDVTAGNAAPHFRTENGAVVKLYQQTSAVGTASWVGGAGSTVTDLDTFDGYTIGQIVKALRNAGFLQ